jgi:ankyrin repeat protein
MGMYDRDWYKDPPRQSNWFSQLHPLAQVLVIAFGIALAVVLYFRFTSPHRGHDNFPDAELDDLRARLQEQSADPPIHAAAENGDVGRVAQLLTADPALVHSVRRKDIPDQPLHVAALAGNRQVANLLLRHGADVNARGDQGMTPLHCAALNGNLEMAELLLKRGADPTLKDDAGDTALQMASRNNDPVSLKLVHLLRRKSERR